MGVEVKILCDSVSESGGRITTFWLRYPRFIHAELMTHRMFSRNASSSRAIPVEKLITDILNDTAMPMFWGQNQAGMSARNEQTALLKVGAEEIDREVAWLRARDQAIETARAYAAAGYHKQIVNRLLEPFAHICVVVTATNYSNFFALRCHADAQPEIKILADKMRESLRVSVPNSLRKGDWHVPFILETDRVAALEWLKLHPERVESSRIFDDPVQGVLVKLSVARCARTSYRLHDGAFPTVEADMILYDKLMGSIPLHASPAEHQAMPDPWSIFPDLHGNFKGFIQYRKLLTGECQ